MSTPKYWRSFPSPIAEGQQPGGGASGLGPDHERYRCSVKTCSFRGGYRESREHYMAEGHDIVLVKMPHWGAVKFPAWQTNWSSK